MTLSVVESHMLFMGVHLVIYWISVACYVNLD